MTPAPKTTAPETTAPETTAPETTAPETTAAAAPAPAAATSAAAPAPAPERLVVYTKEGCPACHRLGELLRSKGVAHDEVSCASVDELPAASLARTFPQVFDSSKRPLGGYQHMAERLDEPLLAAEPTRRFTPFPLRYPDLWDMYLRATGSFWTADEVSLVQDVDDWRTKLDDDERRFVKHVLAFFAGADGIVMENIQLNFSKELQVAEARQFLAYQAFNEAEHCVAPETRILTRTGYHAIGGLEGEDVEVWNGEQWSATTIRKTGVDRPLVRVELDDGMALECTPEHKWFVVRDDDGRVEEVRTRDLRPGDVIAPYEVPVLDLGDESGAEPTYDDSPEEVPVNGSLEAKLWWLESSASPEADGTLVIRGESRDFLREVQLMLTTTAVVPRICERHDGLAVVVDAESTQNLGCLGLPTGGVSPLATPRPPTRVSKIVDENRRDDTYCFTEPLRHAGVFEGVLTGQSRQYALLVDALITDASERDATFAAIETMPAVRDKAAWAMKWLDPARTFAERLLAFVCVEGILFSGSFCAIFWLKHRGLMPGLGLSNQFISRDEGLHQEFGALVYSHLRHRLSQRDAEAIVREAVENEKEFVRDALPVRLIGMNADDMCDYVEFVADRLLRSMGYEAAYRARNPFPWMELISLGGKTNFFEKTESEYRKAGVGAKPGDQEFGLDEDF